MGYTIIRDFKEWFQSNEQRWKDRGEQVTYKAIESTAVVEITGESYLASITVWVVGACDTIALSTVTNKEIWVERYDFQDFKEVTGDLEAFIKFLNANNPATQI